MPCALVHFQWLWIIKKNLQPLLQHPIQLLCLWKVIFLKKPCTLWVLVSVVPHYQLPNLLRMAQGCCTQQPNNLLSEVGFCPSAQQFWWNRQNKIIKKNLLHILVGPTALEGSRENLQGATLQTTNSIHHAEHAPSYSQFISKAQNTWWALATAPSPGLPECSRMWGGEHRDTGPASPKGHKGPARPHCSVPSLCLPKLAAIILPAVICRP